MNHSGQFEHAQLFINPRQRVLMNKLSPDQEDRRRNHMGYVLGFFCVCVCVFESERVSDLLVSKRKRERAVTA